MGMHVGPAGMQKITM